MPLILAVHLYVYLSCYKKIINTNNPDLPRCFKCFRLQSMTQKPQSASDLNASRASEMCHMLWSKIKKEMLKAPGNLKGIAAKQQKCSQICFSMSNVSYRVVGGKKKRFCQFWVHLNSCNIKNLNYERQMNQGFFLTILMDIATALPHSRPVVGLSVYSKEVNTHEHKINMVKYIDKHKQESMDFTCSHITTDSTHINVNSTDRPILFLLLIKFEVHQ